MLEISTLTTHKNYLISNHPGLWRYSRCRGAKYFFWRFSTKDVNRRVSISLTAEQVQSLVWEEVSRLNLSKLEAFCGQ
jgi:hypothetical protein